MTLSVKEQREIKRIERLIALKVGDETGDYSGYKKITARKVIKEISEPENKKKRKVKNKTLPTVMISEERINRSLIKDELNYIRFNYKRKPISQIAKELGKPTIHVLNSIRRNKMATSKFIFYKKGEIEVIGTYYQLQKIFGKHVSTIHYEKGKYPERFFEIKKPFETIEDLKKTTYFNDLEKMYQTPYRSKDNEE